MLGRNDGLVWACSDFSGDGTHPSSTGGRLGQLKVATQLLNFLKTDDTTIPWYLAPKLALTPTAGNNQTGTVGVKLPTPLTVLASNLNGGAPQPGLSVTFSDAGKGGTFGTPTAITGSNGIASSTYTLPSTAKTITVTASTTSYSSATFTETSTPAVATVTVVSGGKQTGVVGTTLPLPLTVKAKNSSGAIVVGAPITFADGGIGGTFSPTTAITGSNGQASTTFTLPTVAKIFTVTATDSPATVNITETSTPSTASALTIVQGNNQSAHPKNVLPKKLIVMVADKYGNGIAGVTVTFTDNGAGGTFSTTMPVTTSNGQASVSYTTGANLGTVTISASTSTLGPVKFTETVN